MTLLFWIGANPRFNLLMYTRGIIIQEQSAFECLNPLFVLIPYFFPQNSTKHETVTSFLHFFLLLSICHSKNSEEVREGKKKSIGKPE